LTPERTPPECGYVTSPGRNVRALATDLGVLEKLDGDELVLTAVPAGENAVAERVDAARAACGWDLSVAGEVRELSAPNADEIAALRRWDPRGWFLRDR
jgi:acyl CoA:acetate/3-ketoacid CoA transferase beta subunit